MSSFDSPIVASPEAQMEAAVLEAMFEDLRRECRNTMLKWRALALLASCIASTIVFGPFVKDAYDLGHTDYSVVIAILVILCIVLANAPLARYFQSGDIPDEPSKKS